ncbi:MAG: VTT domain-containing protein [Schleiferiaceae bacterium]|nr:VTT domain-containing protein [Schleiferiaceae bacterium]
MESHLMARKRNARIGKVRRANRGFKEKGRLAHHYFRRTGRYKFWGQTTLKLAVSVVILALVVALFNHFVVDPKALLGPVFDNFPLWIVFAIFFVSESFMGFLPPDAFIIWTGLLDHTWWLVALLAVLSYSGGQVSYWTGRWLQRVPWVRKRVERRFAEQFETFRKFGRMLVIISSLTPLPFSPICVVAGTSGMRWREFSWSESFRLARFGLYAWFLLGAIN